MIESSKRLMKFSLISFVFVFVFGVIRSMEFFKTFFNDQEAMKNIMLFHSHFDQLCWLGAAAIGAVFYVFNDLYLGKKRILENFIRFYIIGTLLFALSFLIRALGFALGIVIFRKFLFILLVSIGGFIFILLIGFTIYILYNLKRTVQQNTKSNPY